MDLLGISIPLMAILIGFVTAFAVWIYAVDVEYSTAEEINAGESKSTGNKHEIKAGGDVKEG